MVPCRPNVWEEAGSLDIRQQAAMRVKEVLSTHYPEYIKPDVDKKIRGKFPIQVPEEYMKAGSERW